MLVAHFELGRSPAFTSVGIGVFVVLIAAGWWIQRRDLVGKPPIVRRSLGVLRLSVLSLLLWIFLDPRRREEHQTERVSQVVVLLDNSASMTIEDETPDPPTNNAVFRSRWTKAREAVRQSRLFEELSRVHDVHIDRFGTSVRPVATLRRSPSNLASTESALRTVDEQWIADDPTTHLGDALSQVLAEHADPSLAGVVLISDGQNNGGGSIESAVAQAVALGVPIHTVPLGSDELTPNPRVVALRAPQRAHARDPVTAVAELQLLGGSARMEPVEVQVALRAAREEDPAAESTVETARVRLTKELTPVRFNYASGSAGRVRLTVVCSQVPGERRLDDNQASVDVEFVDQRTNVFLLAGGPSREYHFVRALLQRDRSMALSQWLQSAEPSFALDGSRFVWQLPPTDEAFFAVDAMVAIDPDWSRLSAEDRDRMARWVGEHAGGFVVVADVGHLRQLSDGLPNDPLRMLMPIELRSRSRRADEPPPEAPKSLVLTRDGERSAYLRLDDDPEASQRIWSRFPGFFRGEPVSGFKAGATILATLGTPSPVDVGGQPAIVAHDVGSGRVVWIGSGELWRMRRDSPSAHEQLWVRLVREVSKHRLQRGRSRGELLVDSDKCRFGTLVAIRAVLLDEQFKPVVKDTIEVTVTRGEGTSVAISLQPEPNTPGRYRGSWSPASPGEYVLRCDTFGTLPPLETRVRVDVPRVEYEAWHGNHKAMEQWARSTSGRSWRCEELSALPSGMVDRSRTILELSPATASWDHAGTLFVLVGLMTLEWVLRKRVHLG